MIRLTFYIILSLIIALGAAWLASNPGQFLITWQGWEVRFSTTTFISLVIIYSFAIWLFLRLLKWLNIISYFSNPKRLAKKRARATLDLDHAYSALALGNHEEALKFGLRAKAKIGQDNNILRLLSLATQASENNKNNPYLKALKASPEASAWANMEELNIYLQQKSWSSALELVQEMLLAHPKSKSLLELHFFLLARLSKWSQAHIQLLQAIKEKAIQKSAQGHLKAVLEYCCALEEKAGGRHEKSINLLNSALKNDPDYSPAALLMVRLYMEQNEIAKAEKILNKIWHRAPNDELAILMVDLYPKETADETYHRIKKMTAGAGNFPQSHHLLANAAINAQQWPQARAALDNVINSANANKTTYQIMALLEQRQKNDAIAAAKLIEKSLLAPDGPRWICGGCHTVKAHYLPICPTCQEFDTIAQSSP